MPALNRAAAGTSYVNGPTNPTQVRSLVGDTDLAGWQEIYANCYKYAVQTLTADTWYPVSTPTAQAEKRIVEGVRADLYTVTIQVALPYV